MATTRLQKWGNSYGLRIPKSIMEALAIHPDTQLNIHQEQGRIIITPIREPKPSLDDLLAQITPENLHRQVEWGDQAGEEAW